MMRLLRTLGVLVVLTCYQSGFFLFVAADQRSDLDDARSLWEATELEAYTFIFQRSCFCLPEATAPKTVLVVNGVVESVETLGGSSIPVEVSEILTVPQLFLLIQNAIDSDDDDVTVVYNVDVGYPESVTFHGADGLSDDQVTITIEDLLFFAVEVTVSHLEGSQLSLNAARATWDEQEFDAYKFTFQRLCYCLPSATAPKQVVVIDGDTILRVSTLDGDELPIEDSEVLTIAQIFDVIQGAIDRNVDMLEVVYNANYGYPESIDIDADFGIADEEVSFLLTDFEEISPDRDNLETAQSLWEALGFSRYAFKFQMSCVCEPEFTTLMWVEVADGQISRVVSVSDGSELSLDVSSQVPTVAELYTTIEEAIHGNAISFRVEYNTSYGYPELVIIDYDSQLSEEEMLAITISDLVDLDEGFSVSLYEEYNAARSLWATEQPDSYSYEISMICSGCYNETVQVFVEDGIVTNSVTQNIERPEDTAKVFTIEELFGSILNSIYLKATMVNVVYNDQLGFPESVLIDQDGQNSDENLAISVFNFLQLDSYLTLVRHQLEDAQLLWSSRDISHYVFDFHRSCISCGGSDETFTRIEVREGAITSAVTSTGESVLESSANETYTILGLFELIGDAIALDVSRVDVLFNEEYGYPETVFFDYNATAENDEFAITVENLIVLDGTVSDATVLALDLARTLWDENAMDSYAYDYMKSCDMCPELIRVVVEEGAVAAATSLDDMNVPGNSVNAENVDTVEELFQIIEDAITFNADTLDVAYNEVWGYPESIQISYSWKIAGEQQLIMIRGFLNLDSSIGLGVAAKQARSLWEYRGIDDYAYVFRRVCFCASIFVRPMEVVVENGSVISATTLDSEPVPDQVKASISSIDGLFLFISKKIGSTEFDMSVEYNTTFGYPEKVLVRNTYRTWDINVVTVHDLLPL